MGWDNLKFSGAPKNNAKIFKAPHPPKKESIKLRAVRPNQIDLLGHRFFSVVGK